MDQSKQPKMMSRSDAERGIYRHILDGNLEIVGWSPNNELQVSLTDQGRALIADEDCGV